MGVTSDIAAYVCGTNYESLPPSVIKEAKRDVINVVGVSLYASRDPSLQILLDMFAAEGGKERAGIWGTRTRTTLANAALANGYLSHLEDYDDTHFPTVIHPSAPTVPAAFAIAEDKKIGGRDLLAAVALGNEFACRLSMAVHPWHYDLGWHITGTFGVFGSAIAAGKLLGLNEAQLVYALGIAGTQAAGVREVFGSMSKPFHAGRAAQAGLTAALLAQGGFTSTAQILEGRRGVPAVMSTKAALERATEGLGERWELFSNGLKPYSCGVVSHPLIDACLAIARREKVDLAAVEAIEAEVHPLVPELMGRIDPQVGLEGKFSARYCAAVALTGRMPYPDVFTDAAVHEPAVVELHRKVDFMVSETVAEDAVRVVVRMKDGQRFEEQVEHATGAPENPMSDEQLNEKFMVLAVRALELKDAKALLDRLWKLDELDSVTSVFA